MALSAAFKKDAEVIAEEIRADLEIRNIDALDPFSLLEFLGIPVISLSALAARSDDPDLAAAIEYLRTTEQSLSAVTVFAGQPVGASVAGASRMVVYNDASTPARQASDLTHEAAHSLLLHEPAPALDELGCRAWNNDYEAEAQHLGGCLLIPAKGARYAAKAGWTFDDMGRRFGCSTEMATWRNNISGGNRLRKR